MPLSLSEIKDRAIRFTQEWQGETDERAGAQSFWIDFFHVFDVKRRWVPTELSRLEYLFEQYRLLPASLLPPAPRPARKPRPAA